MKLHIFTDWAKCMRIALAEIRWAGLKFNRFLCDYPINKMDKRLKIIEINYINQLKLIGMIIQYAHTHAQ